MSTFKDFSFSRSTSANSKVLSPMVARVVRDPVARARMAASMDAKSVDEYDMAYQYHGILAVLVFAGIYRQTRDI